ncbi:MAG: AbrB/MazE/SpoVT family DNA-binding domain-containing protein [Caulobacteraceae bacterium]
MSPVTTRISENGRLTIPATMRAALGLERGSSVVLEIVDGDLRVRSVAEALRRARATVRRLTDGRPGFSVDDFLAERRREAEREA